MSDTQILDKSVDESKKFFKNEYIPEVNIYIDDANLYLEANIPGASENSVDVSVEKNILTISAAHNPVAESENLALQYAEYEPGDYRRTFQINESIDVDQIKAVVKNGVLYLNLPLRQPAVKKIAVAAN
ncbi:MAG: Hsp20/alpha crystallin family protein [Spirochaetia bacterium]|nr:Hsp20/alpha crystallin family protein [Spirochaetia bacterium]